MDSVAIALKIIVPTQNGTAIFLGNEEKVFVIYVDNAAGAALTDTLEGKSRERPSTHDLLHSILTGFGAEIRGMTINHAADGIFHARLRLSMSNELGSKIVEIDTRPSDALILISREKRPVHITADVFDELEDMSEVLKKITEQQQKP